MKKTTIFITMMMMLMILFANATSAYANETDSLAKITFTTVYNDVKGAVSALAEGLKVGAEHVYTVLVKQQTVSAIIWLMYFVLCIPFSLLIYKAMKWAWKIDEPVKQFDTREGSIIAIAFGCSIILLMWISAIVKLPVIFTGFFNPEYGAIKEIMNLIK